MLLKNEFDLETFTYSDTAVRKEIDNNPPPEYQVNLRSLYEDVLLPLKTRLTTKYAKQIDIQINSGYRSEKLNKAIGGAGKSQHSFGEAADTVAVGISLPQYFKDIVELVDKGALEVDQCIYEFNKWVHISYRKGKNRKQFLGATKVNGKTVYNPL